MYAFNSKTITKTSITINQAEIGETIETKVQRITQNKEPILDGAPLIYTERKDGVLPQYDPRTDRMELAVEAMDTASRNHIAKRQGTTPIEDKTPAAQAAGNNRNDGKPESSQATE